MITSSSDGTVTSCSAAAQRLFSVAAAEVPGKRVSALMGHDLPEEGLRRLRLMGLGSVWVCGHHIFGAAGQRIPLVSTFTVAEDPDGALEVISYTRERGSSWRPEAKTPRTTPMTPNYAAELTLFCDESMVVAYVGASLTDMFGQRARSLVGRDVRAGIFGKDQLSWQRAWTQALAQPGRPSAVEVRVRHADGRWLWTQESITSRLDDPTIRAMVVTVRNADDLHEANRLREISEQTLLSVLEASIQGVWITDARGSTIFVNPRMSELLGLRREELMQSSVTDVVGDSVVSLIEIDGTASAAGIRDEREVLYPAPDGASRWLRFAVTPLYFPTGARHGSILMCAAIADRGETRPAALERLLPAPERDRHRSSLLQTSAMSPFFDEVQSRRLLARIVPALSHRESEIVTRLLLGDRVPTIARNLFISQSTVRNHLAAAFRKAGVGNQQELIKLIRTSSPD